MTVPISSTLRFPPHVLRPLPVTTAWCNHLFYHMFCWATCTELFHNMTTWLLGTTNQPTNPLFLLFIIFKKYLLFMILPAATTKRNKQQQQQPKNKKTNKKQNKTKSPTTTATRTTTTNRPSLDYSQQHPSFCSFCSSFLTTSKHHQWPFKKQNPLHSKHFFACGTED